MLKNIANFITIPLRYYGEEKDWCGVGINVIVPVLLFILSLYQQNLAWLTLSILVFFIFHINAHHGILRQKEQKNFYIFLEKKQMKS